VLPAQTEVPVWNKVILGNFLTSLPPLFLPARA
jgi:hypothetical protein